MSLITPFFIYNAKWSGGKVSNLIHTPFFHLDSKLFPVCHPFNLNHDVENEFLKRYFVWQVENYIWWQAALLHGVGQQSEVIFHPDLRTNVHTAQSPIPAAKHIVIQDVPLAILYFSL